MSCPPFVEWLLEQPGYDVFAAIPVSFMEDEFNLYDLNNFFHTSLDRLLNVLLTDEGSALIAKTSSSKRTSLSLRIPKAPKKDPAVKHQQEEDEAMLIQREARLLYELLHQRYIQSRSGMEVMWRRYIRGHFGACPRVACRGEPVLPIGPSALPGQASLKWYCPRCQDIYQPTGGAGARHHQARLDGVGFGPSFAHLLILTHINDMPPFEPLKHVGSTLQQDFELDDDEYNDEEYEDEDGQSSTDSTTENSSKEPKDSTRHSTRLLVRSKRWQVYVPRIFGFRIHPSSPFAQQMQWLRENPQDYR